MSTPDRTPDRRIGGLTPRTGAGEPTDLSRLRRHTRAQPEGAVPPAAAPAAPAAEPRRAPSSGQPPAASTTQQQPVTTSPTVSPKVKFTTTVDGDVLARGKAAFRATNHLEGDESFSDFVERALLAEITRREELHHDGTPWPAHHANLKPGRPVR